MTFEEWLEFYSPGTAFTEGEKAPLHAAWLAGAAQRPEVVTPSPAQEEVRERILAERAKGNVVFMGLEGMMSAPLEEFIKQPADGILYDLNRLEEVCLTYIDERKWVNDFAVALVIRKLKAQVDSLLPQHGEGTK